jgi:hypothetical protein
MYVSRQRLRALAGGLPLRKMERSRARSASTCEIVHAPADANASASGDAKTLRLSADTDALRQTQ